MRMDTNRLAGFTLIEILIVIALVGIAASFIFTGFMNYATYQRYVATETEVASLIKEARQRSLSSINDTTHGVRFASSSVTSFRGSSYSAGDPSNVVTNLFGATLSIDLTAGTDEIVFARKTGAASATGTISIIGANSIGSTTLTIEGTGLVQQP